MVTFLFNTLQSTFKNLTFKLLLTVFCTTTQLIALACETPKITRQPHDVYACQGRRVVFQCLFKDTTQLTISWERSSDNGATWNVITGGQFKYENTQSLMNEKIDSIDATFIYRCVGTNGCGTTYSNTFKFINTTIHDFIETPSDDVLEMDLGDTLWIELEGSSYYKWLNFNPNFMTDESGNRVGFFPTESIDIEYYGIFLKCPSKPTGGGGGTGGGNGDTTFCELFCDTINQFCFGSIYTDTCKLCDECFGYGDGGGGSDKKGGKKRICIRPRDPGSDTFVSICVGFPAPGFPSTLSQGSWSPSTVSNFESATYVFTPTDNVCSKPSTYTVLVQPPILPSFSIPDELCALDDQYFLPRASNEGIYGYWYPSEVDMSNTETYYFTPESGQCAETTFKTIHIKQAVSVQVEPIDTLCSGDNFSFTLKPDFAGISFTWSPNDLNPTSSTTYTITPDLYCSISSTYTVQVKQKSTPLFTQPSSACKNSFVPNLPTTSTNGFNGQWFPAMNNTSTTTYTFTPNGNQCATSTSITQEIKEGQPIILQDTVIACIGDNLQLSDYVIGTNFTSSPSNPSISSSLVYTITPTNCDIGGTIHFIFENKKTPVFQLDTIVCGTQLPPSLPTNSVNGITGTWSPSQFDASKLGVQQALFTPNSGECATTLAVSITKNPNTIPTFNSLPEVCVGQTAPLLQNTSLNGIDGTWSPSQFSTSKAGNYTATFTPNDTNCVSSVQLNLSVVDLKKEAQIYYDTPLTFCEGDSVLLYLNTTNAVVWYPNGETTNTIKVKKAGKFAVTVSNSSCQTKSDTVYVSTVTPPKINIVSNSPICEGDTLIVNSTLQTGNYQWTGPLNFTASTAGFQITNVSEAQEGKYNLKFYNGACQSNYELDVIINNRPTVSLQTFPVYCIYQDAVQLTQGVPSGGQYNSTSAFLENNQVLHPKKTSLGKHNITYIYSDGKCENSISGEITIDNCLSTLEMNNVQELTFYPNPADKQITIQSSVKINRIQLFDNIGKLVYVLNSDSLEQIQQIDLSKYEDGTYIIQVETNQGSVMEKISIIH